MSAGEQGRISMIDRILLEKKSAGYAGTKTVRDSLFGKQGDQESGIRKRYQML
jgi:hypothetical protein